MAGRNTTRGVVLLAAIALLALGAWSRAVAQSSEPDQRALDDAVRFRATFGFATDDAIVRNSFQAEGYSEEEWGVPLSKSELAELARRSALREAAQSVLDRAVASPSYGGFYRDQSRRGQFVFLSTSPEAARTELEGLLPKGVEAEFRGVARTRSDLDELQDAIHDAIPDLWAEGIKVVSIGIDIIANQVSVGVDGLTVGEADRLVDRFGPGVAVEEQASPTNDACVNMTDCWPLKGGLEMYSTANTAGKCTTGFLGRRNDSNAMVLVTAGHCAALNAGTTWGHHPSPSHANDFGWDLGETWTTPPAGHTYARADVGLVQLRTGSPSAVNDLTGRNYILWNDSTYVDAVAAVRSHADQHVGDEVCRMGWGTWNADVVGVKQGRTCGIVKTEDVSNWSCNTTGTQCRWIMHTWEVNFDSIPGDSGGPVYLRAEVPPFTIYAYGTLVHSDPPAAATSWYSPVTYGINAYDLLPLSYTYRVCVSYSC